MRKIDLLKLGFKKVTLTDVTEYVLTKNEFEDNEIQILVTAVNDQSISSKNLLVVSIMICENRVEYWHNVPNCKKISDLKQLIKLFH